MGEYISSLIILITMNIFIIVDGAKMEGIVGGILARKNQFKYIVSVQENGKHVCGGGIIADSFIISLAQCFLYEDTEYFIESDFSVVVSTINLLNSNGGIRIPVKTVYVPITYAGWKMFHDLSQDFRGELAILELEESLGLDNNTRLSKLDIVEPLFSHARKTYRLAGFGYNVMPRTGEKGSTDGKLRYSEAESVSSYASNKVVNNFIGSTDIGARLRQRNPNLHVGACTGDGGSPLVYQNKYVVGILYGSPAECTEQESPSIYARVSHYYKFMKNALQRKRMSDMRVAVRRRFERGFKLVEL